MHIVKYIYIYPQLDPNSTITCKTNIQMKKSCYEFKIELFTFTKIWNDDIDDDIGDTRPLMPIKNTLNIEKNDLQNDFIIQSCNTLDHKTQNFDDGFTISSNSMIMNELK